jgi:hypothetical protein
MQAQGKKLSEDEWVRVAQSLTRGAGLAKLLPLLTLPWYLAGCVVEASIVGEGEGPH